MFIGGPSLLIGNSNQINYVGKLLEKTDLFTYLLQFLKRDLSECAAVSRAWKVIVYNQSRLFLVKENCFGAKEWSIFLKIKTPLNEPRIPLDFSKEDLKLMLNPGQVITDNNESISTSDFARMEKLFKDPRQGKSLGFDSSTRSTLIKDPELHTQERHWIAYKSEPIGPSLSLEAQEALTKETTLDARVSSLTDTVIICLMEKLRTGKCPFNTDTADLCIRVAGNVKGLTRVIDFGCATTRLRVYQRNAVFIHPGLRVVVTHHHFDLSNRVTRGFPESKNGS